MRYPDFGECQLQSMVNIEMVRHAIEHHHHYVVPMIPTLVAEYHLGWDTGFLMPYELMPPSSSNQGCNLFIQYKLSEIVEGVRGGEYEHWQQEYFRFQLPHYDSEDKEYDYHQLHALQNLSQCGYSTYYATNHSVELNTLVGHARQGVLLDRIPFLDVADIDNDHFYCTFTQDSSHFVLCSEIEEAKRKQFTQELERIKPTSLLEDVKVLKNLLKEHLSNAILEAFMQELESYTDKDLPNELRDYRSFAIMVRYLRIGLNIHLLRFLN